MYYHVDRSGKLEIGNKLQLNSRWSDLFFQEISKSINKNDITSFFEEIYPEGLSNHGIQYLIGANLIIKNQIGQHTDFTNVIPMIELKLEETRRRKFGHYTSRMQSFYCFETMVDAIAFGKSVNCERILIVDGEKNGKFDMNQIYLGGKLYHAEIYSDRYWNSVGSINPKWEILLKFPVTIKEIAQQDDAPETGSSE